MTASTRPAPRPLRVVVTGASSGIGRATAQAFAREGAALVLAARGADALEAVAAECTALHPGVRALAVPTDVTDGDAVQALAHAALAHLGHIDVWVNNVGVGVVGLYQDAPMAAHRRVVEANLIGHMQGAHAVLPHFLARGRGVLINMISAGGWIAAPYAAAYSASKFGLRGFSEALRAELHGEPDIHVCDVFPSFVDTPGVSHGANYTGRHLSPGRLLVDPHTVARAIVRLARHPRPVTPIGPGIAAGRLAHAVAPGLLGRLMAWGIGAALARAEPAGETTGNVFDASATHAVDGGYRGAAGRALPAALAVGGALALVGIAAGLRRRRY